MENKEDIIIQEERKIPTKPQALSSDINENIKTPILFKIKIVYIKVVIIYSWVW